MSLAPGYQQSSQLSTVNLIESGIYPTYQKTEFLNQAKEMMPQNMTSLIVFRQYLNNMSVYYVLKRILK